MSGPFRFNQQSAQSPLERVASPLSAAGGQPVSYKTNVNRAKTKKWVEAKKNAYDGDDWGDYDEYDEYGVDTTPPPEPAPASNPRYYGQRPQYDTPSRSFTDPAQQLPLPKARKNSFDAGEEQRSFSASVPDPQQQGYAQQPHYGQPPLPLQTGGMGRDIAEASPQSSSFSPSAVPQPLQTRLSTGPAEVHSSPATTQFPPRKSSIGQGSAPNEPIDFVPIVTSPRERAGSQDKPLPFIRPADIYKRVEEERRRESMESQSRPSLDSLIRPKDEPTSPIADRRNLQPLETVAERKSEYLGDLNVDQEQAARAEPQKLQHERVPSALKGIETFDNDFWSSGPDLQAPATHAPAVSPTQDQGFRSVVDQAFTRSDESRSIPPTPISKDSDSDLNRSNTGSTSGISPIMSRVPSSATAALKNRGLGDGSTPMIAEEPHEAGTSVSRPTSGNLAQAPHPFQGHTRNVSSTSLPRSGLATPTGRDSPARSPVFGPQKTLPEPETAQITTDSPDSPDAMRGGLAGPGSAYATREADIATAMLSSPVRGAPELGAAEKQSQDAFLESHHAQSPISDALPRDRSESPSKGRVQALAGKFGDVSHSRRGSTQSNISRNSVQSWERSNDNSRAPSPTKGSPSKPGSPKKEFRPHLPGGWESYAITTPAAVERSEAEKGLNTEKAPAPPSIAQVNHAQEDRGRPTNQVDNLSALGEIDLTPTTRRHQAKEVEQPAEDPILALKNAGAAMTESLKSAVGLGTSNESGQEQGRRSYGDVYMSRPLHMERTESALSSIPPTPPAKDTPASEFPPTPPLKETAPENLPKLERPGFAPQLSTDPSADDQESDRLRKEIVASLSPLRNATVPLSEPDPNSLRPDSKGADRASSILDSYYAELDRDSPRTSNDLDRDIPELAPLKSASSAQSSPPPRPAALNHRFSWEASTPQLMKDQEEQAPTAVPEPTKVAPTDKLPSPTIERAVEEEQQQWSEGIPADPYFGPGHTFTVTKPEPMTDAELAARAPTPPLGSGTSLTSPPTREQTRSPGLHIVNSAVDPEAVDLPPRWSAEHASQPPKAEPEAEKELSTVSPPLQVGEERETNPAVSANTGLTGSIEAPESSALHEPEARSPTSPKSPSSDKPLGAREIATIGSAAERIATYNKTREQWATTDHGLSDWITATFHSDPSLETQVAQPPFQLRPQSGTFRHKHSASLAMLGKFTSSSNNQTSGASPDQYNSAGAQVPNSSGSPTAGPSKSFLGRTGSHSIQTQQMQAKGKDLLHTAGVLSGKGMTSAKGLFAKGKSRFNRDKDSAHSREAPRELETVTTPTTTEYAVADSPVEQKRRRRFSSPFRRSRSRPRSASANFPSTASLVSATSPTAPADDIPDVPKAFQGQRPHSYHAPDLGMHPAYRGSSDQLTSTSPSYTDCTAIQASPTRSSFVTEIEVRDNAVPPVPPISAGSGNEQRSRRRESWGNAGLMMRSVVRHATPPAKGSRSVGASPVVAQFDVPGRTNAPVLAAHKVLPHALWNDDEPSKSVSPRNKHSSPNTRGLWMGKTSPVPAKRTPANTENLDKEDVHQPVLPKDTDSMLEPADLVQLSKPHQYPPLSEPRGPSTEFSILDRNSELLERSPNSPKKWTRVPWPGTLMSTSQRNASSTSQSTEKDEAPLPQEFVMQLSGEISPLLHSSKASLQEVSDDDFEMLSPAGTDIQSDQVQQRLRWETELFGADDVSDEEESAQITKDQSQTPTSREADAARLDEHVEQPHQAIAAAPTSVNDDIFLIASGQDVKSIGSPVSAHQNGQACPEVKASDAGDVSPTNDQADSSAADPSSTQALDLQSALESKVVGEGDVSPISTEASVFVAAPSKGPDDTISEEKTSEAAARPSIERFYSAGIDFDMQPPHEKTSGSDAGEAVAERPRIEKFETAQEGTQGSSELTIPRIRQPASRYATVLASEPVVSYKEYTGSSSSSSDDLLQVSSGKPQALRGAMTPPRAELNPEADMRSATRQVSATQLQVVHAVEEYAASNSSLASWDQDSNATDTMSEPGAAVAMKDESNLDTPVAQVPRNASHRGQHADRAGNIGNNSSQAATNGYYDESSTNDHAHRGYQNPAVAHNMTVPERSKSLLSIISSAVSSVPISPASSNAGRSTPSTIHRMQRNFSNAKKSNLTDTQIPEEPTSAKDDQTPTTRDEDYDLYADHNGVVKDVRDGNGQPLRIDSPPNPAPTELARTTTGASSIATAPDIQDSPGRRYSFERPMSFVYGAQDDDGRPQDQINQPLAGSTVALPLQSQPRSQHHHRASSGALYSSFEPMQDTHWPPGEAPSQPPAPSAHQPQQHTRDHPPAKVVRQPTRFVPNSHNVDDDDDDDDKDEPPAQPASNLPPQRTPPAIPKGPLPPNVTSQTQNTQDRRVAQNLQAQNRSVSTPLQYMAMPAQDHRVVSQPLGSPPTEPAPGPRNEFEYHQQMMQLQAKYPRFRGNESRDLNAPQPGPAVSAQPGPEKPASKPRLAAAIKGIVGKTSPHAPPPSNVPTQPSNLASTVPPTDASRPGSFVSAVSSLSREPNVASPTSGLPGGIVGPQRPPSLGADSQYSHVSQGSTQVQPAQSRQDLTMLPIPPQFQSLHPQAPPPQQPQQLQLAPPQQSGQSQGHRASTGTIPEAGKKKRFSAFTGLFGKSNPAAEPHGKFKLSREEKKAQKAQRHTSQPLPQSQPAQQWPPPNTQVISPQYPHIPPGRGPAQNGQVIQPMDPRFGPSQAPRQMQPQVQPQGQSQFAQPQMQGQAQSSYPPQQQRPSMQEEGSAYLRTKQLAEEHRARQAASQPPRPVYENPNSVGLPRPSSEQPQQQNRESFQRPSPSNGYYYLEKPPPERDAYGSSHEEQQRALNQREQQLEAERRHNAGLPRSPGQQGAFGPPVDQRQQQQQPSLTEQGAYGASQAARQQVLQQRQEPSFEQGAYGASQEERQRMRQQSNPPLPDPKSFGRSQIHYDQIQQHNPPQRTMIPPQHERQQIPLSHQQGAMTRDEHIRQQELELAHHRWQQQQIQLRQFHLQQQAQLAAQQQQQQQQAANRSVSGPLLSQASPPESPVAQRHVSQPEPQYETPPIPGAYGPVQGVFVSPLDQPHAYSTPHDQFRRQGSDPHMQAISPQISAQSQMQQNGRHHSDASSVSMVSPIAGPSPEPGQDPEQRQQRPRMPSIAEVHQQAPPQQAAHQQQPWHMNFPPGTTEQDIVRARQKQFFQQQFASQQQAQAERHAASPSPRVSPDKQSPPFSEPLQQTQEQGGGFREVLPRKSPQPYTAPSAAHLERRSPRPLQHSPSHSGDGAGWPLNSPPGSTEPRHVNAGPRPISNGPHTPRQFGDVDQRPTYVEDPQQTAFDQRRYEPTPPSDSQRFSPPSHQPRYDEDVPNEAPPSYDGPGEPNDGMEKSNPDRPRPPNIITQPDERGRQQDGRPRQASLGLMQHPQPASMAASPQRTAPDMGAESLRRQMLQQEEHARMERIQRSQMQAAQRQREQQEREVARARAQELERSVSGGGRVGSLRSVRGSHNGGTPGWERRGLQGGHSRPVFELPAVEDDEPVMRATSFPGQEWVPPMYVDD